MDRPSLGSVAERAAAWPELAERGAQLAAEGQLDLARQHLEAALAAGGDVRLELGIVYTRLGYLRRAQSTLDAATDSAHARAELALVQERYADAERLGADDPLIVARAALGAGRVAEAIERLEALLPHDERAALHLGHALLRAGNTAAAAEQFAQGEVADPVQQAHRELGLAECAQRDGDLDRAETLLQTARLRYRMGDRRLDGAACELRLARLHASTGNVAEAEREFRTALQVYEGLGVVRGAAESRLGIATLRRDSGDWLEAEFHFLDAAAAFRAEGLATEVAVCALEQARSWLAQAATVSDRFARRLREAALEVVVPAMLFAAAGRYSFRSAYERRLWNERVAEPSKRLAFALAAELGETRLLAELIAEARSTGTYVDAAQAPRDQPTAELGAAAIARAEQLALTAAAPVVRLLGDDSYRLDPPPFVRMPSGELALSRQIAQGEQQYRMTTRARTAVEL